MNKPVIVQRQPPDLRGIGGGTVKVTMGSLAQVAYAEHKDGNSRPHTVIVSSPGEKHGDNSSGVAVRVTMGNERGPQYVWAGAPCVIPAVGQRIIVEAMLVQVPYTFGASGPAAPLTNGNPGIEINALVLEGWTDYPTPDLLVSFALPVNLIKGAPQPILTGPVYVQAMTFKNQGTTAVPIVICDKNTGSAQATNAMTSVVVPAGTTIGLGAAALGGFFQGVQVWAVLDLTAGPPFWGGTNTDGQNVTIDVWGNYLVGSGG